MNCHLLHCHFFVQILHHFDYWPRSLRRSERGYPLKLRLDNGPELISVTLADWAEQHGVTLEFIRPGRPMQNGFIERFNRSYREAVLDMFVFQSLDEVREQTEKWLKEYNEERPHDALGDLTPREYLLTHKPEISINSRA